jgi:hypothetical protein
LALQIPEPSTHAPTLSPLNVVVLKQISAGEQSALVEHE